MQLYEAVYLDRVNKGVVGRGADDIRELELNRRPVVPVEHIRLIPPETGDTLARTEGLYSVVGRVRAGIGPPVADVVRAGVKVVAVSIGQTTKLYPEQPG